jgi:hypothetical protein
MLLLSHLAIALLPPFPAGRAADVLEVVAAVHPATHR